MFGLFRVQIGQADHTRSSLRRPADAARDPGEHRTGPPCRVKRRIGGLGTPAIDTAAIDAAADDAREAAEAAAMADEEAAEEEMMVGGVYRRANTSTPNLANLGFSTAGNNNGFNEDYSIYERIARVSASTLEADPGTAPNLSRAVDQDFTIEPVLVKSWERPDDLTWVFDVRTDPVWHTGRPFDIDDIHYMFSSLRDPDVAGPGVTQAGAMTENIDTSDPVDDTSYRFTLSKPTGYIETLLEQANVVDRMTWEDREETAQIVGTGPYTFDNYDPNRGWDQLPHHDHASNNPHSVYSGGGPQFDRIQHTIFADTAAMGLAFEAGELDSHQGVPIGLPEIEARLLEDPDVNAFTGWGLGGRTLRFRADAEPFRNKLARQAVLTLVDADRVQREFGGTFDKSGRLPWQPGSAAFVPDLDPHAMSGDQDAARAHAGPAVRSGRLHRRRGLEDRHPAGAPRRARARPTAPARGRGVRHRDGGQPARVLRLRRAAHLRAPSSTSCSAPATGSAPAPPPTRSSTPATTRASTAPPRSRACPWRSATASATSPNGST